MTNQYSGLWRGPIDHNASSVINAIVGSGVIIMGNLVQLSAPLTNNELLPTVIESSGTTPGDDNGYGIVVGGDFDGIYGDGVKGNETSENFAGGFGQGVVVVTQGRCLAQVKGSSDGGAVQIEIGDPLRECDDAGVLDKATLSGEHVIARALQVVPSGSEDIIAIDFQREGAIP